MIKNLIKKIFKKKINKRNDEAEIKYTQSEINHAFFVKSFYEEISQVLRR